LLAVSGSGVLHESNHGRSLRKTELVGQYLIINGDRMANMKKIGLVCLTMALATASTVAGAESPYEMAWIRQLNAASDQGQAIFVDALGSAYIAGTTSGSLAGSYQGALDAFVFKYDNAGNQLWGTQLGATGYDLAFAVCADSAGCVYMAGNTSSALGAPNPTADYQVFVSKHGASGQTEWIRQFGNPGADNAWGLCVDGWNSVYVCGYVGGALAAPSAGRYDAFVRKYDCAGNIQWTQQFGTAIDDYAIRMTTDTLGNVYVAGYSSALQPRGGDHFLRKYTAEGALLWSRQESTPFFDSASSICTDPQNNVYIAGYTEGAIGGTYLGNGDAYVEKYDADGKRLWTRELGTPEDDNATGMCVDARGAIFVSGTTTGSLASPNAGQSDIFLCEFDSAGNRVWATQFGTPENDMNPRIAADSSGAVFMTGYTYGALGATNTAPPDVFLARFAPVPEPSTLALLAIGAIGLLAYGWRRRK
jgi:hypothetical protein